MNVIREAPNLIPLEVLLVLVNIRLLLFAFITLGSSLLYIGEYSTLLVLFLTSLALFYHQKYIQLFIFLPLLHFILIKLFVSGAYAVYFVNLGMTLYYIYNDANILSLKKLTIFIFYTFGLSLLYSYLESFRYEMYLELDIVDSTYNMDLTTVYVLSALHIFILFFMAYKCRTLECK